MFVEPAASDIATIRRARHGQSSPGYAEKLAKNDPADLPKINHALGALPVLEINGHVYSQSVPIARWAALTAKKKPNQPQSVKILYPETDLLAQLLCDELMATASEVHDRMPFGGENLLEKRAEFKEGFMKKGRAIFHVAFYCRTHVRISRFGNSPS